MGLSRRSIGPLNNFWCAAARQIPYSTHPDLAHVEADESVPPHRFKYKTASPGNGARKEVGAPVDLISPEPAGVPFAGSIHS